MVLPHNPTVRGRRLARELRELREQADLRLDDAAQRLGWNRQKVLRIEKAITKASPADLNAILDLYGVSSPKREALIQLSKDAWKRGWWTAYRDIYAGTYLSLEDEASRVVEWQPLVVPGIFQTPDYAREVTSAFTNDPNDIDRRVAARMTRRSLLARTPAPERHVVLDEAVLCRWIGGREIMRAQFESLLADSRRANVTMQVLPYERGRHPGLNGAFTLLMFEPGVDPDIVYLETSGGGIYLEAENDVARHRVAFEELSGLAMSPEESRERVEEAVRELATDE
ncbi:helix-turn-helix domain-containing protein [Actinomadura hibisca]|uniref:helix-turn-helix domain-containing protein n=1 Tax=Actinomadura hibisca TaxID=68565 RepID=UPI00082F6CE3|nr:helix-turn-helix transcriptional regulator [Actinomadura hibisca]